MTVNREDTKPYFSSIIAFLRFRLRRAVIASANCEDNATCKPEGGNGGTSGNASKTGGTTKGGSTKGGSNSTL